MSFVRVLSDGNCIASRVRLAADFFSRFKGLMLKKALSPEEGLLLVGCSAIHCCFMRFPIDVVYLDKDMNVLAAECVRPWRLGSIVPGTENVLELAEGRALTVTPGAKLEVEEV